MQGVALVAVTNTEEAGQLASALRARGFASRVAASARAAEQALGSDVVRVVVERDLGGVRIAAAARHYPTFEGGHLLLDRESPTMEAPPLRKLRLTPVQRPFDPKSLARDVTEMMLASKRVDAMPRDVQLLARAFLRLGGDLEQQLRLAEAYAVRQTAKRFGDSLSDAARVLGEARSWIRIRIAGARSAPSESIAALAKELARWTGSLSANVQRVDDEAIYIAYQEAEGSVRGTAMIIGGTQYRRRVERSLRRTCGRRGVL